MEKKNVEKKVEKIVEDYLIANQKTLVEMSNYVPLSSKELENITGFGKAKVHKYGDLFLDVLQKYASIDNLQSSMELHPKYLKSVGAKERKVVKEKKCSKHTQIKF